MNNKKPTLRELIEALVTDLEAEANRIEVKPFDSEASAQAETLAMIAQRIRQILKVAA